MDMRVMFRSGTADRSPVPADRSPLPATGRPVTRRPVQVDPVATPAAGLAAGEVGVATGPPPTGDRVAVEWAPVPATGPTRPPVPADRWPVPVAGPGRPVAGPGRPVTGPGQPVTVRMYRSLVLKLSKSGSGIWAPNSLSPVSYTHLTLPTKA